VLLIVLALFWVALLTPVIVRRFREGGTEKSIQSFHAEHEVLSRQDYTVLPAHRLDQADVTPINPPSAERRPRLKVVQPDDTLGTLESRSSWDEWSENYEYDESTRPAPVTNRYAQAYASRPSEPSVSSRYEPPIRRRTMKAQRRVMFTRVVAAAAVFSLLAYFTGSSIVTDLAALSWFSVVVFVALALFSVSQGYLSDESLPLRLPQNLHVLENLRLPQRRPLASVEPLYFDDEEEYAPQYEPAFSSEFYEPDADEQWLREPQRRRALG
jgi:hypothetical protein